MTTNTPTMKVSELSENHVFSEYVRILGRGKTGSRSLTQTEAETAMQMILGGQAEEAQIGAFLMLLRVKEESAEELAGFVQASRDAINAPNIRVDIDWSSYAGKKNQLPWNLLSAKLLAKAGKRVFIHGAAGTQSKRLYTEESAAAIGISVCSNWQQAQQALDDYNICYLSMKNMSPIFYELLFYRRLFGLRSAMHSVARLINPLSAPLSLQGVFHPAYGPSHQQASLLLAQTHSAAFKGEGGEAEIRPDADTKLSLVTNGNAENLVWPRLLAEKAPRLPTLNCHQLNAVWEGTENDTYGYAATISTAAMVLWLSDTDSSIEAAQAKAAELWQHRLN